MYVIQYFFKGPMTFYKLFFVNIIEHEIYKH